MKADDEGAPSAPTLAGLVSALDAEVLQVLAAPRGLDVPVTEPTTFDANAPTAIEPGDLVLAVGVPTESTQATNLLQLASTGGAAGVVFKTAGPPPAALLERGASE